MKKFWWNQQIKKSATKLIFTVSLFVALETLTVNSTDVEAQPNPCLPQLDIPCILRGPLSNPWWVTFSPDGQYLAASSQDRVIYLWAIPAGHLVHKFVGHKYGVNQVEFSPDGQWLASASIGHDTPKLWEVASGQELRTFGSQMPSPTHEDTLRGRIVFSPDGRWLISGWWNDTIKVWDVRSGKLLRTLSGHDRSFIMALAIDPEGKVLASGAFDGSIKLWNLDTGQMLRELRGHDQSVNALAFSPDGRILVSSSPDFTIRLWDVETGESIATLNDVAGVNTVAFSPDGQYWASGSFEVKLWKVSTRQLVHTFDNLNDPVWSVAFSPDGHWLAAGIGQGRGEVRLWDVQRVTNKKRLPINRHGRFQ